VAVASWQMIGELQCGPDAAWLWLLRQAGYRHRSQRLPGAEYLFDMHILLLDQHLASQPCHHLEMAVAFLAGEGLRISVCGPAVGEPQAAALPARSCWPIRLDGLPSSTDGLLDWRSFLHSLTAEKCSLTAAAAGLAEAPLGLLREAVRRVVTMAVDQTDVDVIFVAQAGLLLEFAIETGPPVAAYASAADLAALESTGRLREIVSGALGSCELLAADSPATAQHLYEEWVERDPERPIDAWSLEEAGERIHAACRTALARRFTP
jgi:hypothetical protein